MSIPASNLAFVCVVVLGALCCFLEGCALDVTTTEPSVVVLVGAFSISRSRLLTSSCRLVFSQLEAAKAL